MRQRISALLLGASLAFAASGGALAQDKNVKIGVLTDNSGLYSAPTPRLNRQDATKPRAIGDRCCTLMNRLASSALPRAR